jgi:hypothetical protein
MPTFAPTHPPYRRISLALVHLREARTDGEPQAINVCIRRLDELLERVACRPLSEIDPSLDVHLRVSFNGTARTSQR